MYVSHVRTFPLQNLIYQFIKNMYRVLYTRILFVFVQKRRSNPSSNFVFESRKRINVIFKLFDKIMAIQIVLWSMVRGPFIFRFRNLLVVSIDRHET